MATATKKNAPKKPKPLTPREKRLLAILPEAKDLNKALIEAGYSETTANKAAKRTVNQLVGNCRNSGMTDALEKVGINQEFIAQKHMEGLEAYKVVSAQIIEKGAGAADKDFVEVPDFPARHKHLDTIHKLRGDFTEKVEVTGDEGFANILAAALNRAEKAKGEK
jgi:hypothetical protein